MLFSPQIPLELEPRRSGRFEDFVAGPNLAAVNALKSAVVEPGSLVFLSGAAGSGKSHLLNAACMSAREAGLTAFYLGLARLPASGARALDGLEGMDLVCIDDLHAVVGQAEWEEALFHFINRLREAQGRLVTSSRDRLRALPIGLPDLASRLGWGLRLDLQGLDDTDKAELVRRHASALGVDMPDDVVAYLIRRSERSPARLVTLVEQLRHAAFTDKRRITVPLARQVLQSH